MKYTKLGNSELTVSRICMGCMGFGAPNNGQHTWTVDEAHTREIVKGGLELGANFFDTAMGYQNGTREEYLGRALKDFARRDDVVVATKFIPRTNQEIEEGVTGQEHIERMIDQSLARLGMDYVDLYIYHMWDYQTPLYDIMDGLNRVVKEGKTRYIGISNCFAWQLAKANALARQEGFQKFVSVQGHYHFMFRGEERAVAKAPRCSQVTWHPHRRCGGVGRSRATIDSGWRSADHQGGQTGKTVHPKSYVALGISGAIQHKAGMQDSECIIAVNKNENAPIFEIADYGICGDLFKVTPMLIEAIKAAKAAK